MDHNALPQSMQLQGQGARIPRIQTTGDNAEPRRDVPRDSVSALTTVRGILWPEGIFARLLVQVIPAISPKRTTTFFKGGLDFVEAAEPENGYMCRGALVADVRAERLETRNVSLRSPLSRQRAKGLFLDLLISARSWNARGPSIEKTSQHIQAQ